MRLAALAVLVCVAQACVAVTWLDDPDTTNPEDDIEAPQQVTAKPP